MSVSAPRSRRALVGGAVLLATAGMAAWWTWTRSPPPYPVVAPPVGQPTPSVVEAAEEPGFERPSIDPTPEAPVEPEDLLATIERLVEADRLDEAQAVLLEAYRERYREMAFGVSEEDHLAALVIPTRLYLGRLSRGDQVAFGRTIEKQRLTWLQERIDLLSTMLEDLRGRVGPLDPRLAPVLEELAWILGLSGMPESLKTRQVALLAQVAEIREAELAGARPRALAEVLDDLGALLVAQRQLEAAEPYLLRAVETLEGSFGRMDPGLIDPLERLAALHRYDPPAGLGRDLDRVDEDRGRALEIREATYGPESDEVLDALRRIGGQYQQEGRWAEAAATHARRVGTFEDRGELETKDAATALSQLGVVQQRMGELDAAERSLRRAMESRIAAGRETGGAYLAGDIHNLAEILIDQGRLSEAEAELRRAWAMVEPAGWHRPHVRAIGKSLRQLLEDQGRDAEAAAIGPRR